MAYRQEHTVAEIIDATGVLEGRTPWYPGRDDPAQRNPESPASACEAPPDQPQDTEGVS